MDFKYNFFVHDSRLYLSASKHEIPNLTVLEQIDLSIAKWESVVEYLEQTGDTDLGLGGASTCALCVAYNEGVYGCLECPIKEKTGYDYCLGTPHEAIENDGLTLERAKAELRFLRELRKEYE